MTNAPDRIVAVTNADGSKTWHDYDDMTIGDFDEGMVEYVHAEKAEAALAEARAEGLREALEIVKKQAIVRQEQNTAAAQTRYFEALLIQDAIFSRLTGDA